jgi:hypothetical protein
MPSGVLASGKMFSLSLLTAKVLQILAKIIC